MGIIKFLLNIAGPLEVNLYIVKISLETPPTVIILILFPGKEIEPKLGPSFPLDDIIIIFLFIISLINNIIFSSLKFIPPNDIFNIFIPSFKTSFNAFIIQFVFVSPSLLNILYIYKLIFGLIPSSSEHIIEERYVPCPI